MREGRTERGRTCSTHNSCISEMRRTRMDPGMGAVAKPWLCSITMHFTEVDWNQISSTHTKCQTVGAHWSDEDRLLSP